LYSLDNGIYSAAHTYCIVKWKEMVCKNGRVLLFQYNDSCDAPNSRGYSKWTEFCFVFWIYFRCHQICLAEESLKLFGDFSVDNMIEETC
jgi:hypothetical protein